MESYTIGGQVVHRNSSIDADEPFKLLGSNSAPNPQELLMTALNACITVGYVAGASMRGLPSTRSRSRPPGRSTCGAFSCIDPAVAPGYETIHYVARIKGDGTPE